MISESDIRAVAIRFCLEGITPSVRNVANELGGGDWKRIAKVLKELRYPNLAPRPQKGPQFPDYLVTAINRFAKEQYEKGRQDTMNIVDEQKSIISELEAKVAALTEAIGTRDQMARVASPAQIRSLVETSLRDFLEQLPEKTSRDYRSRYKKKEQGDGPSFKGTWKGVVIDGMTATRIYKTRNAELTPEQLEWKRSVGKEVRLMQKAQVEG